MNRLVNFSASIANSGLNLLLVLLIARTAPTSSFADFTTGVVYGGPFAVLLAFGNDTILARTFRVRPGFARLVASIRLITFVPALGVVLLLHSVQAAAGFCFAGGTALQQRFYFEATNSQLLVNGLGIAEKLASIVGVFMWLRFANGDHPSMVFWWIVFVKVCAGALVSAPIVITDRSSIGRDVLREGMRLYAGTLPFLFGYVATQSPALLLVGSAPSRLVADFGTASQVGSGLLAALTLWQRPAVHRYLTNDVSIRRELLFSVALAAAAVLMVYAAVILYGTHFKLLAESSVIHGFILLSLVTAVLHPFEIRGYASGRITGRGLVVAAFTVFLVAIPLSRVWGFWAVPLAMIQYQLVIFLYHRLWVEMDDRREISIQDKEVI